MVYGLFKILNVFDETFRNLRLEMLTHLQSFSHGTSLGFAS
ncbi:MAG: hypothetical protein ABJC55_10155 [Algoriphagus sp.]